MTKDDSVVQGPRYYCQKKLLAGNLFVNAGKFRYASLLWGLICLLWAGLVGCQPSISSGKATDVSTMTKTSTATAAAGSPSSTIPSLPSASPNPAQTETAEAAAKPDHPPTPTPLACWRETGPVETGSLPSDLLPLPLDFTVHLPPCYLEQPDRRYPVLYLIHGQNYNQDQWERLGVPETARDLLAADLIVPFILVLPRDRSWSQPNEDMFGKVLAEALVPWIDEEYRTLPDRQYRAIGGLSRGAGWAVHLGLSRWDLFGRIGAHSLPVFWTDTYHIRSWLDAIPTESLPKIFMDIGEKDRAQILRSAQWFENLLAERNIPHEWYLFPGYHEEAYWQSHTNQYLRWYASEW